MVSFLGSFHIWGLVLLASLHFSTLVNKVQSTSAAAPESYFTQFCNWSYTTTREKRFSEGRNFITNGTRVRVGTYQFNVFLEISGETFSGSCSGSILDEYHILTAAHCVVLESRSLLGEYNNLIWLNQNDSRLSIKAMMAFEDKDDTSERKIMLNATSAYVHSMYTFTDKFQPTFNTRDIAVLRLEKPLEFDDNVRPVCLASPTDELTVPAECSAFGYGRNGTNQTLEENQNAGLYLRYAGGLNVYTPEQRRNNQILVDRMINHQRNIFRDAGYNDTQIEAFIEAKVLGSVETGDMFAFVEKSGTGICQGDSGGPLLCKVNNSSSKYMKQFAITSATQGQCGVAETLLYFESVQQHLDWLEFVAFPTLNPSKPSRGQAPKELYLMCGKDLDWKRLGEEINDTMNSGNVSTYKKEVYSQLKTNPGSWINSICRSYVAYLTCRDNHHTPAACDKMEPVVYDFKFGVHLLPYFTELRLKDTTPERPVSSTTGHTLTSTPGRTDSPTPAPESYFTQFCNWSYTTTREKRFSEGRNFITNGTRVRVGTYQFNIAIKFIFNASAFGKCSGSILDEFHILTAAHCVVHKSRSSFGEQYDLIMLNQNYSRLGIESMHVYKNNEDNERSIVVNVTSVYVHSDFTFRYKHTPTLQTRDIAVLRLEKPLEFDDNVRPVCLASPTDELTVPAECTAFGYGRNGTNRTLFENQNRGLYLLYADGLNVYTSEQRRNNQTLLDRIINHESNLYRDKGYNDTQIEALIEAKLLGTSESEDLFAFVDESRKGICHGDSGGPLMCKVNNSSSEYMKQFAINEAVAGDCGVTEMMMMFEPVQHHLDWLEFVALPTLNPTKPSKGKAPNELFLMCKNDLDWKRLGNDIVSSSKVNGVAQDVFTRLAKDDSTSVNSICRSYVAYLTCKDNHHTPAACDKMKTVVSDFVFGIDLLPYFARLRPKVTVTTRHTVPTTPRHAVSTPRHTVPPTPRHTISPTTPKRQTQKPKVEASESSSTAVKPSSVIIISAVLVLVALA